MAAALLRILLAGVRARKLATLLCLLAIALGVALGLAVELIHRAALDEFGRGLRELAGASDLQVVGPGSGFDDASYARVAAATGVRSASPVIDLEARLPEHGRSLRIVGIDPLRAIDLGQALLPVGTAETGGGDRLAVFAPDAIFLSPAAMARLGLAEGAELAVQTGTEMRRLRVAGGIPGAGGGVVLGLMDIAAAQEVFGWIGRVSRIDVRLVRREAEDAFRRAVAGQLPAGVQIVRPDAEVGQAAELSRAYRVNLTMLAAIALLTGAFLVFTTQLLAAARRMQEFALLRALGVEARQLQRVLLIEGALVGVLGGAIGIALAHGVARIVLAAGGADLGAGYFAGIQPVLRFDPFASAAYLVLGTLAGIAGAALPARAALHLAPARVLRAADETVVAAVLPRGRWAVPCLALAAVCASLPAWDGVPVGGYAAIALVVVGAVLLLPAAVRAGLRLWPAGRTSALRLARARLVGAPWQAQVVAAGVVVSMSLAVAMAIMVASFRTSVDDWLGQVLPADLYVSPSRAAQSGFLSSADLAHLSAVPGVEGVRALRFDAIRLDARRSPLTLIARDVDGGAALPLVGERLPLAAWRGHPPAWISEAAVDLFGLQVGQIVELPLRGRSRAFIIAGVWRDYARQHGSIVIERSDYVASTGDDGANDAALWLRDGVSPDGVAEAIRGQLGGGVFEIAQPGDIRRRSLAIFDRTFFVTYLMEAVAVVIGLFGVATSFAALTTARRKEFGVLRHLGLARHTVGAMLALEGALTAFVGTIVGLGGGLAVAWILIEVINRQSFHWSMDLRIPFAGLAAFACAMTLLAAVAAWIAGRAAMRDSAVHAVREDW